VQTCTGCHAWINPYCTLVAPSAQQQQQQQWICALCRTRQPFESRINQYVQASPVTPMVGQQSSAYASSMPVELAYKVLETVTPASQHAAILAPTVFPASSRLTTAPSATPLASGGGLNFIFIVDRATAPSDFAHLRQSLTVLLAHLPPDAGLALMSFSDSVTLYDLTQSTVASGHIFTGTMGPTVEEIDNHLQTHGVILPRVSAVSDHLLSCLETMEQRSAASYASLEQRTFTPRAIGAALEWALAIVHAGREYDRMLRTASSPSAGAQASAFAFTRILLLTSGPPDFGPGPTREVPNDSDAYYAALGSSARRNSVVVDYFAVGLNQYASSSLRKLTDPSGGSVYLYPDSYSSRFLLDVRNAIMRPIGYDGSVEVYHSAGMKITRLIGGVTRVETDTSSSSEESGADSVQSNVRSDAVTHVRLQLANCRPDESVAIYYALKEDLPQDYVYLQFVFSYMDWNHQRSVDSGAMHLCERCCVWMQPLQHMYEACGRLTTSRSPAL
jgi:hypothetical protein